MRLMLFAAVALFSLAVQPAPPAAVVPVVVELFTSEGCSSCPPADHVLSRLAKEQPIPGAQVIALGMHVTYWDRLGWKDPASLNEATQRQQDYGSVFGAERMYTPQAVVDGREEMIGSDEAGVRRAIAKAATQPHARLSVTATKQGGDVVVVKAVASEIPPGVNERLVGRIILTEDDLTSIVKRGENGGRTLHNDAVVRRVSPALADFAAQPARSVELRVQRDWRIDRLQAIVFLQGERTRRIWGAAATPVK